MARRKKVRAADLLGPLEAQVMGVVWRHPGATGLEVTGLVNERREAPLSQRTILTVLTRLDAKGFVDHAVEGRAYRYTAVVPEEEFVGWHAERAVQALLDRYGRETAVSGLVDAAAADPALLERLDSLLEQRRGDAP